MAKKAKKKAKKKAMKKAKTKAKKAKRPATKATSRGGSRKTVRKMPARRRARVATAADAAVFAIMLDALVAGHPDHFPITSQATSIDPLRALTQHNGQFFLIPRGTTPSQVVEAKDLTNTLTGARDNGNIFRIGA